MKNIDVKMIIRVLFFHVLYKKLSIPGQYDLMTIQKKINQFSDLDE